MCKLCSEPDCNTHPREYPATLSCLKCNDSEDKCSWLHNEEDAIPCEGMVQFSDIEECYIKHNDFNSSKISRGCNLESNACVGVNCEKCQTNGCNMRNMLVNQCIECDSAILGEETCADTADGLEVVDCEGPQLYEDFGCFTYRRREIRLNF